MTEPARRPSDSAVEMNELVLPVHTNALGTIFGGQVMAWIDVCAAMAAMRHARTQCVTASMDALDFIAPIRVGHLVNLRAMVNFVGRTSMEVGVRVESEDPLTGVRVHAASSYLTFVAIDPAGAPKAVPPLTLSTTTERLRYEEARARREQRLALVAERSRLHRAHHGGGEPGEEPGPS
ncbi:MAG: acyl-CoA thioesterase [Myxococcales bacterium]|nr:acyl-CoA thioesterase [Myxococcales bacterium]